MTFGYGAAICPECYEGEGGFLFFDGGYWLNRVLMRLLGRSGPGLETRYRDAAVDNLIHKQAEVEVAR